MPVPWVRREPHPLLTQWAQRRHLAGAGKRAFVPGCGLGADAEYLAGFGFATTAFDVSTTAIRLARERQPRSSVEYVTAGLLHPPPHWLRAFDLVTEIITVQALPVAVRQQAIASVARLTAPGGTLLVIAAVHNGTAEPQPGPPWPLGFAAHTLACGPVSCCSLAVPLCRTAITTQTPQRPAWGGLSRVIRLSYIGGMAETCRPGSSHGNQMARTPIATSTTPTVWPNGFP